MKRRVKIIATLGPASSERSIVRELLEAGVDAVRLNFSHGSHADHLERMLLLREVAGELGLHIPIIQDLQGPKIRVGEIAGGGVTLERGTAFGLTTREISGNSERVSVDYAGLPGDVKPGDRILLVDGKIELLVLAVEGTEVATEILNGGLLGAHQGLNLPNTEVSIPPLTAKDIDDLAFGLAHGVDAVAMSFVQRPADIRHLKDLMRAQGREVPVIAKLEKPKALEYLEKIFQTADAVMVARGDLGVELPPERVPVLQKEIIERANRVGCMAITATQMLESMTVNARPTRAEASDVANAVFDGTDVVMLSGETANGKYPVEAVRIMDRIVREAESHPNYHLHRGAKLADVIGADNIPDAVAGAATFAVERVHAKYLVVFTQTGSTARLISKYRPLAPIIAFTHTAEVARHLNLRWGVFPFIMGDIISRSEDFVVKMDEFLLSRGMAVAGELMVILLGSPIESRPKTNLMRIHQVRPPA